MSNRTYTKVGCRVRLELFDKQPNSRQSDMNVGIRRVVWSELAIDPAPKPAFCSSATLSAVGPNAERFKVMIGRAGSALIVTAAADREVRPNQRRRTQLKRLVHR